MRTYGNAYECSSPNSTRLMQVFRDKCRARGVMCSPDEVFAYLHEFQDRQADRQLPLF